ncbi:hypothetical protein I380019A4_19150 [Sutterella wadsworthensis]
MWIKHSNRRAVRRKLPALRKKPSVLRSGVKNGREALQPSSRIKLLRAKRIAQGKAKASSQWLKLLG